MNDVPSCVLTDARRASDADRCISTVTTTGERRLDARFVERQSFWNEMVLLFWTAS